VVKTQLQYEMRWRGSPLKKWRANSIPTAKLMTPKLKPRITHEPRQILLCLLVPLVILLAAIAEAILCTP
jgi:hypothetical protein